jgi:hypothetical protein
MLIYLYSSYGSTAFVLAWFLLLLRNRIEHFTSSGVKEFEAEEFGAFASRF